VGSLTRLLLLLLTRLLFLLLFFAGSAGVGLWCPGPQHDCCFFHPGLKPGLGPRLSNPLRTQCRIYLLYRRPVEFLQGCTSAPQIILRIS